MENHFYGNKRFKPRKASQEELTRLSVLWSSLSQTDAMDGFRSFPHVSSKLANADVERIEPPVVNLALKPLVKVNYYDKKNIKRTNADALSGRNIVYSESDYTLMLKKLVSKLIPRSIIYIMLRRSNILERYLRICKYVQLVRCKFIDVDMTMNVIRAMKIRPIEEKEIDEYKKGYIENQKFLKQKTNLQIMINAFKLANKELNERQQVWHNDSTYTKFFITGGISFGELLLPKA